MVLPIDPLCLVFVLAHYGDEGVTFYRGVRVERRLFLAAFGKETGSTKDIEASLSIDSNSNELRLTSKHCASFTVNQYTFKM